MPPKKGKKGRPPKSTEKCTKVNPKKPGKKGDRDNDAEAKAAGKVAAGKEDTEAEKQSEPQLTRKRKTRAADNVEEHEDENSSKKQKSNDESTNEVQSHDSKKQIVPPSDSDDNTAARDKGVEPSKLRDEAQDKISMGVRDEQQDLAKSDADKIDELINEPKTIQNAKEATGLQQDSQHEDAKGTHEAPQNSAVKGSEQNTQNQGANLQNEDTGKPLKDQLDQGHKSPQNSNPTDKKINQGQLPPSQADEDLQKRQRMDTWRDPFEAYLDLGREVESPYFSGSPSQGLIAPVEIDSELTREQVKLAIASLWALLYEENEPISFGPFHDWTVDERLLFLPHGDYVMMTVSLPAQIDEKHDNDLHDTLEHYLVTARWNPTEEFNVRCTTYYNVHNANDQTTGRIDYINSRIERIINGSDWLGNVHGRFRHSRGNSVAFSPGYRGNTGIATVLNAWAQMLDIQVASEGRPGLQTGDEIYSMYLAAIDVINLATWGQLVPAVIEAFFQRFGLIQNVEIFEERQQTLKEGKDDVSRHRHSPTCFMSENILDWLEKTLAIDAARSQISREDPYLATRNSHHLEQLHKDGEKAQGSQPTEDTAASHSNPLGQEQADQNKIQEPPSTKELDPWAREFQEGMERCHGMTRNRIPHEDPSSEPWRIETVGTMEPMDFTLPVASIWYPVATRITPYTFSTPESFSYLVAQDSFDRGLCSMFLPKAPRFLIPLLFNNHIVLIVATRLPRKFVHVEYADSFERHQTHGKSQETVRTFLSRVGWAHKGFRSEKETDLTVRQQPYGSNTCGIHTIFNAWARLLGIRVSEINDRGRLSLADYRRALEVINLALSGRMDYRCIMAFMQSYGLAVPQDWQQWNDQIHRRQAQDITKLSKADQERRKLDEVKSVKIGEHHFEEILDPESQGTGIRRIGQWADCDSRNVQPPPNNR